MAPLGIEVLAGIAVGLTAHHVLRGERHTQRHLLALTFVSAGVIGYWQPLSLVITVVLTCVTWLTVRAARSRPRALGASVVGIGITVLTLSLIGFKYTPWLVSLLPSDGGDQRPLAWVTPIGLSFTVFRLIGVILDSRALRTEPSANRLFFLSLFFPTFRSGPIETERSLTPLGQSEDLGRALTRIVVGLSRKVILADPLHALFISPWLAQGLESLTPTQCLLLPLIFGFYVYWDFAGYTDMAIGIAALLGFRASENFNRPYLSQNLSDFWRRWHITLSEWIRLRLFMKLTGRRPSKWRVRGATILSMALCGLWHGAGTNFLLWGVWHGVGLVVVQLYAESRRRSAAIQRLDRLPGMQTLSIGVTFAYVTLGWAFFFLPVRGAWLLVTRAAAWRPGIDDYAWAPIAALIVLILVAHLSEHAGPMWTALPRVVRGSVISVGVGILIYRLAIGHVGMQDFVYARF
jgi:alginate O-acetyltransferase complex protein AlgI